MTRRTRKRILIVAGAALLLAAVVFGFLPEAVPVQTATVERGPLQVVVEEEGETRIQDRYVVSSPVPAFARRIALEPGDPVVAGQPLVELEPPRTAILDPRTRTEAQARVAAARAAVAQADEQVRAASAAMQQAATHRERTARLVEAGSAASEALEQAEAEAEQAAARHDAARAAAAAARADLAGARAALGTRDRPALPVEGVLRAPTAGRVLAVHRKSEGPVTPGEPLVEIGDTERLEVRVDVLSQDAVRLAAGTRVLLEQWGGDGVLEAAVARVQPEGFTRVSALGVEEQRVRVVAELTSPRDAWANLGSGYRVLARFIVWEGTDVLQVMAGALFRTQGGWAVYVVEGGRAVARRVTIGRQSGLAAEVLSGLREGEQVIVHPAGEIEDGVRVRPRR
jgi:HlyD family secretion protein